MLGQRVTSGWVARFLIVVGFSFFSFFSFFFYCDVVVADARPGGGHSSSGGSRTSSSSSSSRSSSSSSGSYSSSRGGGGGDSLGGLIVLGVVVVIVLVVHAVKTEQAKQQQWTSAPIPVRRPVDVSPVTSHDPDFSRSVFEDFVFELYAVAQRTRGDPAQPMAPYLSPAVVTQLAGRGRAPRQVVVGALGIESVGFQPGSQPMDVVVVRIEATLLGDDAGVVGNNVFVVENWKLARSTSASSKPPARTRTWPCPNCGAPWTTGPQPVCAHCGQDVAAGRFDWFVAQAWLTTQSYALASLTGTVEEQGNNLATVIDPFAVSALAAITQSDPQVTLATFEPRAKLVYAQLNAAWNANDLGPVRGFVTASLRNYLEYWLREYARQHLSNKLDDARVHAIHLAKVTRDRYYDAITVRIFADGHDYTVDAGGKVVGGSKTKRRAYTEYWTFVRSSTRRGPVTTTPTCPNCGAAISMSDLGDCTYCNAAVENGSIDWTLSKIEQDDSYGG